MKRNNLILYSLILITSLSFGQDFNFKRKISGNSEEGWYSVVFPQDIFSHLKNDFSDVRLLSISGTDTTEIPYLLRVNEDEVAEETIALPVINNSKKDGKLFLTFENNGKKVNYLDLRFNQNNFFAFVKLEGSHDLREWFEITDQ